MIILPFYNYVSMNSHPCDNSLHPHARNLEVVASENNVVADDVAHSGSVGRSSKLA